jgi:hypothetical protein
MLQKNRRNLINSFLLSLALMMLISCGGGKLDVGSQQSLSIFLLYPTEGTTFQMGKVVKCSLQVTDEKNNPIKDAKLTLSFYDPTGKVIGEVPAVTQQGGGYRGADFVIPHRSQPGPWRLAVRAQQDNAAGEASWILQVANSTSEYLLEKYGFWLDAPRMRNIEPMLVTENGDAQNGLIRWGGLLTNQHIFVENWVELHWRAGRFPLESPEMVRSFFLDELGDLGFTPLREMGVFERTTFKQWPAWQAKARGQLSRYDIQWLVFYAEEVDKTFALGTTVVLPPPGVNVHMQLRGSFEVGEKGNAQGKAPEPLLDLIPTLKLLRPALGARFEGLGQGIVLEWQPVRELGSGEYYEVIVDYNYRESNYKLNYTTRSTKFIVPKELYAYPNCGVFNWQVTLKRQTGTSKDGSPLGEALSFPSLYWYFLWDYPTGVTKPFASYCPNEQY